MPPVSVRYATVTETESPDFQRHVVPLLGRLGCNGRACHGSFQGRGGFQLSLFGYDFQADHAAMLDPETGRVDVDYIDESLVLAKPIDADMHDGGKRMDAGGWQYNLLRRWIASGAQPQQNKQTLIELTIEPARIELTSESQPTPLKAIAKWSDGSREDVTDLCRFSSNDDGIVTVDQDGVVAPSDIGGNAGAVLAGDTHVIVAYDQAVVPVSVVKPLPGSFADAMNPVGPPKSDHPIDQRIADKLTTLGIIPSSLCTDSEFIRRLSLDMTGTLPSPTEVVAFLDDPSPSKRVHLIEDLVNSPGYSAWWATRMSDWTGNSEPQLNNTLPVRNAASRLWYEWLRVRLEDNVPYDEIVEGIVTASSFDEGESYEDYCKSMTSACQPGNENEFASRESMPLYWARRNFLKPEERAIGFAYAFLGIRIECAQCHKHPFDRWSKDDFDQFAKLFENITARSNSISPENKKERDRLLASITGGKKLNGGDLRKKIYKAAENGETVPFFELYYNNSRLVSNRRAAAKKAQRAGKVAEVSIPTGKILGQDDAIGLLRDPRSDLMSWLRDPNNPYFARAIVNRVWANYFGIGIVNPTDDMNLANPASNEPLLAELTQQFIEHDYDLKWLSMFIVTSDAYQRSTITNATNRSDRVHFSRHVPRRLPAEVIHDAVLLATESSTTASRMREHLDDMAIANSKPGGRNQRNYSLQVFGQSERETNCDCDRSDSPSLLQSLYLRNDFEVVRQLADKDGWVAQACQQLGVDGPSNSASASASTAAKRRAEQYRRQMVDRIGRMKNYPSNRQDSMRKQIVGSFQKMSKRFEELGYEVPPLKELLRDPRSWTMVTAVNRRAESDGVTVEGMVEQAYLRTLSRFPDKDERSIAMDYIDESPRVSDGVQSLMWALVNTKEFIVSH
ncbi:MAG: DUF1549 and DUF1553 domain-containing protein [Planctomycetota bacterium]